MIKKFLSIILVVAVSMIITRSANAVAGAVYADTTKPSVPVTYEIKMDARQFNFIDSVLQLSHNKMGRSLTVDEADPIRRSLYDILAFIHQQKSAQDKPAEKKKN